MSIKLYVKDLTNTDLFTVNENDKIELASNILQYRHVRHIPVVNDDNILVGLITPRELMKGLLKSPKSVLAKDIMKTQVYAVEPTTPLIGALEVMIVNKFGCLPIVDQKRKLLGIISEIDLLKLLYKNSALPDDWYIDGRGISYKATK